MRPYAPAAVAALVLGLGIGIAQSLMSWGDGVLFVAVLAAVSVVGGLASEGSSVGGARR